MSTRLLQDSRDQGQLSACLRGSADAVCGPLCSRHPSWNRRQRAKAAAHASPKQGFYYDHCLTVACHSRGFTSERLLVKTEMVQGVMVGTWNDACASPTDQKEGQWAPPDPWRKVLATAGREGKSGWTTTETNRNPVLLCPRRSLPKEPTVGAQLTELQPPMLRLPATPLWGRR